jgi:hypothetical protein
MDGGSAVAEWRRTCLSRAGGRLLGAGLAAGLAACTAPPPAPSQTATVASLPTVSNRPPAARADLGSLPADDQQAVGVLLAHLQRLRGMNGEEMRREYQAANQAYAKSRADENRLRLAMALVTPNAVIRDDTRAAGLLDGALPDRRGGPLGQFVALLQGMVSERGRAVHDEQRRTEALQQKLDALKAIEQSMSEREARGGAARAREPGK